MATFKQRLAPRNEYIKLFLVAAFPVHVWAILIMLTRASSYIQALSSSQAVAATAYILSYTLLESLFVFLILFLLSLAFPARLLGSRMIPLGTLFVFVASLTAAMIHLFGVLKINQFNYNEWAILWGVLGATALIVSIYWINQGEKFPSAMEYLADKLAVLSTLYVSIDLIGVLIVLIRNVVS